MPNFTAGTSFQDGVTNDVTAAKLNALVADAVPTSSLALASTSGTISNFTSSTATLLGAITGSTNVINIGSGQIYKDASGNIGVGTASPAGKLHVNGQTYIQGTVSGGLANSTLIANSSGQAQIWALGPNASTVGSMTFVVGRSDLSNSNQAITIDSSGNVGVGTTSPADILHVSKANGVSIFESPGVSSVGLRLRTNSTDRWQIGCPSASADLAIYTGAAATERLRIDSSGNVGIGTTTPDDKLDVNGFAVLGTDIGTGQTSTKFHKFKGTAVQSTASWFGSYGGLLLDAEESLTAGARKFLITNSLTGNKFAIIRSTNATTDPSLGNSGAITSGTADFVITNTGDIGIGTSSPSGKLYVAGSNTTSFGDRASATLVLNNASGVDANRVNSILFGGELSDTNSAAGIAFKYTDSSGNGNGAILFATRNVTTDTAPTERLRIESSGSVLMGKTSLSTSTIGFQFDVANQKIASGANGGATAFFNRNGDNGTVVQIARDGAEKGGISVTTTAVAYNTTSDYRLKSNLEPISNGINRIKQLPVYRFNWVADESGNKVDGFVAHEAQSIVPESVTGEKDAVDAEGKPIYQGIDQSKIVPLLTAALKEAIAKIEALETKVATLEAA